MDKVVLRRKGSMGVRDILSIGGKEAMESTGFTRVLGIHRNHQRRCMESAACTLEEISSKNDWEPRNYPTTHRGLHTCGGPATYVK